MSELPTRRNEPEPQADESEKTMSLMGGIVRPEGLPEADLNLGERSGGRLLGQGTLLLLIVFVIAAGTIYAMHLTKGDLKSGSKSVKEVEARIEQALAKLNKPEAMRSDDPLAPANLTALFQDTGSIVAMFSTDMTQRQVPIEFIKKDPFELSVAKDDQKAPVRNDSESARQARDRKQRIEMEFAQLKLQTVMQGRVPVAVVNGQFTRVGQTLGSFVVKAIDGTSVKLEVDGQIFELQMQDSEVKTGKDAMFRR